MEREEEFACLLAWLRTFTLQSEVSTPDHLTDGQLMAEVLVKIEPEVFTPTWFAGILQSDSSDSDTLNSILQLLLHYYRHNLGEDCSSGELPVPVIGPGLQQLDLEMAARFLKLMLGVAVTCTNKQTFINKIQTLDVSTQHSLTTCVASFIYTKEWTGRVSSQSLTTDLKVSTPPGDEIWAQKCHELDFQVALLKEERSNLIVENEDLYGKVRAAQTLSRKDSVKARQFETELAHIKDEFERLRLAYESTKEYIDSMESRLRPEAGDHTEKVRRLTKETAELRSELAGLKAGLNTGKGENGTDKWGEAGQVLGSLREQREAIQELRSMIEFQSGVQAGLGREVDCLKDQVDVLRENSHSFARHEQELADIKLRLSRFQLESEDVTELLRKQTTNRTLMSIESETNLSSPGISQDKLDTFPFTQGSNSQPRGTSVGHTLDGREEQQCKEEGDSQEDDCVVVLKCEKEEEQCQQQEEEEESEEEEKSSSEVSSSLVLGVMRNRPSLQEELRLLQSSSVCSANSPEQVDSGMDMTTESTPFTSRPESELVLPDTGTEDEVEATPRQLEMLLEESNSASSVSRNSVSSSVSPDSGLHLETQEVYVREKEHSSEEDTVMESRSLIRTAVDHVRMLEKEKEALEKEKQALLRTSQELLDQEHPLLFDPNDPKVRELEEWDHSSMNRSVLVESYPNPRRSLKNIFKIKKRSPRIKLKRSVGGSGRDQDMDGRVLLSEKDREEEEKMTMDCVNSWLLSLFVKVFD